MKPTQVSIFLQKMASNIESAKNPKKELVIRDLKKILAAIDDEGAHEMGEAVTHDQKELEQALYGRTKPFITEQLDDTLDEDLAGSALFWTAFEELNMVDWIPTTDPQVVYDKMSEICERIRSDFNPDINTEEEIMEVKNNYEEYKTYYMDDQIKKLQELGLM